MVTKATQAKPVTSEQALEQEPVTETPVPVLAVGTKGITIDTGAVVVITELETDYVTYEFVENDGTLSPVTVFPVTDIADLVTLI